MYSQNSLRILQRLVVGSTHATFESDIPKRFMIVIGDKTFFRRGWIIWVDFLYLIMSLKLQVLYHVSPHLVGM